MKHTFTFGEGRKLVVTSHPPFKELGLYVDGVDAGTVDENGRVLRLEDGSSLWITPLSLKDAVLEVRHNGVPVPGSASPAKPSAQARHEHLLWASILSAYGCTYAKPEQLLLIIPLVAYNLWQARP